MKSKDGFTVVNPLIEPDEDKVHRTIDSVLSFIPAGSSIYRSIFTSPIQARTDTWMKEVEARLLELMSLGQVDLIELSTRPEFSAIFLKVLQEVEITSQADKLKNLSNFVVNIALGVDIEEDELFVLTDILKSLTPSHIKALHLYAIPSDFEDRFRELKEFSIDEQGSCLVSFNYPVDTELSLIFYKDRRANVIKQYGPHTLYEKDISYWRLVSVQLENMHLIGKLEGDKLEPPELFHNENNYRLNSEKGSDYIVYLKRQSTDIGLKVLKLIVDYKRT